MKLLIFLFTALSIFLIWHPRGKGAFKVFCLTFCVGFKELFSYIIDSFIKNNKFHTEELSFVNKILFYITCLIGWLIIYISKCTFVGTEMAFKVLKGDYCANE